MNAFIRTKNGRQFDNTAEGALFPSAELGAGKRFGPFNHPGLGVEVTLLATVNVEAKTLSIQVLKGAELIGEGELRPAQTTGHLSYEGEIDGVKVVGFRGKLKSGGLFIQIRPDTRNTSAPTGHLAVALAAGAAR
jgi:hypothetical protein